jgi:broad-specificity NMP kinase|tara:strand:- start:578 stop:745 length:168 start_codon:yes stop_codon:yes gene_type:complete
MKQNNLIDEVDDGFNYFEYRMEELNTDDSCYVKAFMDYIVVLECKLDRLTKQLKK